MDVHVLVPVKKLDAAKTRLAGTLSPTERVELMRELLEHVLGAVQEAEVGPVTVVSPDDVPLLNGAARYDDRSLPWNEALAAAMRDVVREPLAAIVAADLPRLHADEVKAFVAATPARGVAIARAQDGGTNAVAMRPPGLFVTRFGEPGSAALHERAAWTAGADARILDLPGLAFDVDTPEDLAAWR